MCALELDYVLRFAPLFTDRREPEYRLRLGRAFAQLDQEVAATADAPNAKPKMLAVAAARPLLLSLQRQLSASNKPFCDTVKDKSAFLVALDLELGVLWKQNEDLGLWSDCHRRGTACWGQSGQGKTAWVSKSPHK